MHTLDLIKKRKKYQRKRQISEYKKTLKALRNWQIDVKDQIDIPNIYALFSFRIIPRFQYSAKDVVTGTASIAYAYEQTEINSIRFGQAILEHLKRFGIHSSEIIFQFGIHSSEIIFQTDNGSEFIGCIFKKEPSAFTEMVEKIYHGRHQTIPVGKKEYNGSVENFHDRIEDEFYDIESFNSLSEFLGKAWSFILYWNLDRENLKLKKTPFKLIKEKCHVFNPQITNFQPFILDEMKTLWSNYLQKGVFYVADELIFLKWSVLV